MTHTYCLQLANSDISDVFLLYDMLIIRPVSSDVVPRGTASPEAASRQNFHCLGLGLGPCCLGLGPPVLTNLPRSCYCLEAPIRQKPIFLPQCIILIRITTLVDQDHIGWKSWKLTARTIIAQHLRSS